MGKKLPAPVKDHKVPAKKPDAKSFGSKVRSYATVQPAPLFDPAHRVPCLEQYQSALVAAVLATLIYATDLSGAPATVPAAPEVLPADSRGGWLPDPSPTVGGLDPPGGGACGIDTVHALHFSSPEDFEARYRGRRPVVIEGLLDGWPARASWTREALKRRFGGRTVSAGDGANIVMSGGRAGHGSATLAAYLDRMANLTASWPSDNASAAGEAADAEALVGENDLFNFDGDFLAALPELAQDFSVPPLFKNWAGDRKRGTSDLGGGRARQGGAAAGPQAWSILSLGGSRTGLPLHVHGETWLGLVFGAKKWYLYAPGDDAPASVQAATTRARPLMSAYQWATQALPRIKHPERFRGGGDGGGAGGDGGLPLECVQRAGQVLYLPAGWKHATVNLGEAVGVGGQVAFDDAARLAQSLAVLADAPEDLWALKGAGLGLVQQALREEPASPAEKRALVEALGCVREREPFIVLGRWPLRARTREPAASCARALTALPHTANSQAPEACGGSVTGAPRALHDDGRGAAHGRRLRGRRRCSRGHCQGLRGPVPRGRRRRRAGGGRAAAGNAGIGAPELRAGLHGNRELCGGRGRVRCEPGAEPGPCRRPRHPVRRAAGAGPATRGPRRRAGGRAPEPGRVAGPRQGHVPPRMSRPAGWKVR